MSNSERTTIGDRLVAVVTAAALIGLVGCTAGAGPRGSSTINDPLACPVGQVRKSVGDCIPR